MKSKKYPYFAAGFFIFSGISAIHADWEMAGGTGSIVVTSLAGGGAEIYAGTDKQDVLLSTDDGANWNRTAESILTQVTVKNIAINGSDLYAAAWGIGVMYISHDKGNSWAIKNNGITVESLQAVGIFGSRVFAGSCGSGLFVSQNNGESWSPANDGLSRDNTCVYDFYALGDKFYAATTTCGVAVFNEQENTWQEMNTGLPEKRVYALAEKDGALYAGLSTMGVYRSEDDGQNWKAANQGLVAKPVEEIIVSGFKIFAATSSHGIFLSTDDGASWKAVNEGLDNLKATDLAIGSSYLMMTNGGPGIYRRLLSEMNGPPKAPNALSPDDNAGNVDLEPVLQWEAVEQAQDYCVQVAADSLFNSLIVNDSALTGTSIQIGPLTAGTRYFWRVNARSPDGTGVWSSRRSFTTVYETGPRVPLLRWEQTNRNTIRFRLPGSASMTKVGTGNSVYIDVYRSDGQLMHHLSIDFRDAKNRSVDLHANSLPAGQYFAVVHSEDRVRGQPIPLVK
jgi:photosystem II stability/assembly factor-like uncharacterized protein